MWQLFTAQDLKHVKKGLLTVIPRRKFTVNHEKRPSSDPSMTETEFSFVRNGDALNNFLT